MKKLRLLTIAAALFALCGIFAGCESDDNTVTHKITLHNESSYTVVQKISNYGSVTIDPGSKRSFDDDSLTLYSYSPSKNVVRIRESMHTFVYKNR